MAKIYIASKKGFKNIFKNGNAVELGEVPSVFSDEIEDFISEKNKKREIFCKEVADISDKSVELWVLKDFIEEYFFATANSTLESLQKPSKKGVVHDFYEQYHHVQRNGWILSTNGLSELQQYILRLSRSKSLTDKKQQWLRKVSSVLERLYELSETVSFWVVYKI